MLWKQTLPKLDADGKVVVGGMWPHQKLWWNSKKYIKALVTGYGGGKTNIGAKRSISLALHNNGSPHLIVSPTYKLAKRTIIPALDEYLMGRRIKHKYNKSDFEYKLRRGNSVGLIWLASGDKPDTLKGPNVGSALIDEPFIQDRDVFNQVMARVRDPRARHREIGLTGTPEQLNWGYEITEGDERGNFDLDLFQASTRANKALPAQFIESLVRGYDELAVKAYVDGEFVDLNVGLVYRSFSRELNKCETVLHPGAPILVGLDFNVDPMTAALGQEIRDDEIHFCEEIYLRNSSTEILCKELKTRYPDSRFVVYPDSTGKNRRTVGYTDFEVIREILGDQLEELLYPPKNPRLMDRFNAVNGMACNSRGERKLFVNTTACPELTKDLTRVTQPYEEYKNKNPLRTHISDAAGYLIARRYPYGSKPTIRVNR